MRTSITPFQSTLYTLTACGLLACGGVEATQVAVDEAQWRLGRPVFSVGDEVTPTRVEWSDVFAKGKGRRTMSFFPAVGEVKMDFHAPGSDSLMFRTVRTDGAYEKTVVYDAEGATPFSTLFPVEKAGLTHFISFNNVIESGERSSRVPFDLVFEYPTPVISPDPGTPKVHHFFRERWDFAQNKGNVIVEVEVTATGTLDAHVTSADPRINPSILVYSPHGSWFAPGSTGFAFIKGVPVRPGTYEVRAMTPGKWDSSFDMDVWAP